MTNWKFDQMTVVSSSEIGASSDLISDEFQRNLSSKYKAAVIADAVMIGAKADPALRIYRSWAVKDIQ